jgi:peptidoglycan/LPS O-acetylase OafA/YrhL
MPPTSSAVERPSPTREPPAQAKVVKRDFQIPSLDGLRAISFFVVFVSHAGLGLIPGGFGVTVFFFLSGYLITTLMRLEHQSSGTVSLRDFYLRRVLRILPPFYLVLGFATLLVLTGLLPGPLAAKPMLALAGHVTNLWAISHGMSGQPSGTGVYWSLAVEEHFYFLFPILFLLLQRVLPEKLRVQGAILLGLCALVLAWRIHLVANGAPEDRTFLGTDTRVDSILFGCILALAANPMIDPPRIKPAIARGVFVPAGFLVLIFCFIYREPWFRETWRYTLQGLALTPIFIVAMREPDWGPFKLLNLAPLKRVGVLSYALYLVHQVLLAVFHQANLRPLLAGALALGCALLIAELMQRYVEKPCAKLRKRLSHANWISAKPR